MKTRAALSSWCLMLLAMAVISGHARVTRAAPPELAVEPSDRVVITLCAYERCVSPILRVADVADLRGGDKSLRQRIAALDLDDAPPVGRQPDITPRQIEFRIRLAGIDPRLVTIRSPSERMTAPKQLAGSVTASASRIEPKTSVLLANYSITKSNTETAADESDIERLVLKAARKCLAQQLPWPEENVVIQLAQPLPRELRERTLSAETTCSAELRTPGTPLGRVSLRVIVKAPEERVLEVPVQLEVRHFEDVVVTRRPVVRGHVFAPEDLAFDRQDVTSLVGFCTSPDQLVGQKSRRILPGAAVLRAVDLEPETRVVAPVLVKRRDRLKVVARSGNLVVVIVGEAQQDGRVGEVIKVKNVDSNSMIYGRVISATEVEVTD